MKIKSTLFKLKEWLTVPDAAKYLSAMFEEKVNQADVLRLGLDNHLKLSVNFVNHAYARPYGKMVLFEEWEKAFREDLKRISRKDLEMEAVDEEGAPLVISKGNVISGRKAEQLVKHRAEVRLGFEKKCEMLPTDELSSEEKAESVIRAIESIIGFFRNEATTQGGKILKCDGYDYTKVSSISGVWDLPMIGAERLDTEHKYQILTGGPRINLTVLDGAFVQNHDGEIWQLQESFENNEFVGGSTAQYEKIIEHIVNDNVDDVRAKELVEDYQKTRREYLKAKKERSFDGDYYPAGNLPTDSVKVVRTQALIDLQERLSQSESTKKTTIDTRSETTYLNIIGAMLQTFVHKDYGEVDFPSEAKLRDFLNEKYQGFSGLTQRTLAEKFAAAKKAVNDLD